VWVVVISSVARADEAITPDLNEMALFSLESQLEHETDASSKTALPVREAPSVVGLVTHEEIESYGWLSLNDILVKQPGFSLSHDYDRRTISARGMFESWSNNHLLLLIDGLPQNEPQYGSAYTWETTPLYDLESVEIIRGPGSALYGSNATNGVLSLKTRRLDGVDAQLRIGDYNTQTVNLLAGRQFSKVSFTAAYSYFNTDGNEYPTYDGSGRTDASGAPLVLRNHDHRTSHNVNADLRVGEELQLQLRYLFSRYGTGHGWAWVIPDEPEDTSESQIVASIQYRPRPRAHGRFTQSYALSYHRFASDWNAKLFQNGFSTDLQNPDGTTTHIDYPNGIVERLQTDMHNVFARIEYAYNFWREMTALAGVENSIFIYTGDAVHTSNVNLAEGATPLPFPGDQQRPVGPFLEWVRDHPVENLGVYLQLATGRVLRSRVSITAGLRYDLQYFQYTDISDAARPTRDRTFSQLSPRLGVVFFPWKDLTLKWMVDRAFRAPAPAEMFGANTYLLSSNIKQLKPESITTVGLAADLTLLRHINLRANWFYERLENQIAFSVENYSLATNVYSRTITGVETELHADYPIRRTVLSGFFNYSYAYLIDETIEDRTITKSPDLTWAPAHLFNVGLRFTGYRLEVTAQGHYQGRTLRRASDSESAFAADRPASVAPWFTVDARAAYEFYPGVKLGVQATNLFDVRGYLIKNNDYPFDYRIEGLRVLGTLELALRR
jgi:iron complex outermembrane receptor protein